MSAALSVLVLATALGVVAATLVIARDDGPAARSFRSPDPQFAPRVVISLTAGLLVVAASGWLFPAVVVGVTAWFAVQRWQRRDRTTHSVERTDALASWIENLRDVLIAGDQPIGAIAATVHSAPQQIRPQVRRLSAGLGRQEPDVVFRRFADDIDDPLGDLVAAGLLIAVQRGARTVAVLTALAEQARQQADRRRLVEAERAPVQREVGLLTLIMGSLIVGLLVFGRAEYLQPYETGGGQLFLGVVIAIYAVLLLRVQRLARYPKPSRFLMSSTAHTTAASTTAGSARKAANR
jgi:tight adherence protein B